MFRKILEKILHKQGSLKEELLSQINLEKLPAHIAIIMDGNGRWAKKRGLPRPAGHRAGVESLRDVVRASSSLGIKYLTVYAFSTENWKRPEEEVNVLMNLLVEYLRKELQELNEKNVRINSIGKIDGLPSKALQELSSAQENTKNNTGLVLNLALNYGGRAEIIDAVNKIAKEIKIGIYQGDVTTENFNKYLYTSGQPDPDIIIRPSGELRISNFLLWQSAYSELWFTDCLWPEFRRQNLYEAIISYQKRSRRYGGLNT